ncbi:MAG: DUF4248 domain-containing protein [Bacteroidaceae bacterium]
MRISKVHDVAWKCFPDSSRKAAVARLRRWIRADQALYNALLKTGYRQGQRRFTPSQVEVIRKMIGM